MITQGDNDTGTAAIMNFVGQSCQCHGNEFIMSTAALPLAVAIYSTIIYNSNALQLRMRDTSATVAIVLKSETESKKSIICV